MATNNNPSEGFVGVKPTPAPPTVAVKPEGVGKVSVPANSQALKQ